MEAIILAFVTGLTTGGLSCLAVQGGLLASSIAHEVESSVGNWPARSGARTGSGQVEQVGPRAGRPILLFLAAKLAAYTVLGALLGLLGSVLQLTPAMRAVLLVAIGVFMIGSALRMLNVHPIFRYFAIEPPASVRRYIRRRSRDGSSALAPLFLGALTVLIPCGVTQAMMAVAMATGSPVSGAAIMFAFVLGTSPVFFTVAYLTTRLGARLERNFARVVAAIMLVLGLVSLDGGLTLAGWPYSVTNLRAAASGAGSGQVAESLPPPVADAGFNPAQAGAGNDVAAVADAAASDQVLVTINVENNGYQPEVTHAKPGQAFQLALVTNGTQSCSRAFVIPSLGIQEILPATGTVLIDIPAQEAGSRLRYSCSMGMYSGVIVFDA